MAPPDLTNIAEDRVYAFLAHLRTTLLPAVGVIRVADVLVNQPRALTGLHICAVIVSDATGNRCSSAVVEGPKMEWTDDNRIEGPEGSSLFPTAH